MQTSVGKGLVETVRKSSGTINYIGHNYIVMTVVEKVRKSSGTITI